jgi:hypothetical protein
MNVKSFESYTLKKAYDAILVKQELLNTKKRFEEASNDLLNTQLVENEKKILLSYKLKAKRDLDLLEKKYDYLSSNVLRLIQKIKNAKQHIYNKQETKIDVAVNAIVKSNEMPNNIELKRKADDAISSVKMDIAKKYKEETSSTQININIDEIYRNTILYNNRAFELILESNNNPNNIELKTQKEHAISVAYNEMQRYLYYKQIMLL